MSRKERHVDKLELPGKFMESPHRDETTFQTPDDDKGFLQWRPVRLFREIWREITFGVGAWGTLRPLITALLASIPFLFLGQHFNRQHRKGFDWMLLQIPLALTIVLWICLWLYSIFDAWRAATQLSASD